MATLGLPTCGYGIRYDYGLFRQIIKDGWQQEYPEEWLSFLNPWEFERPEVSYDILFGGRVETVASRNGRQLHVWHPADRSGPLPTTRRSSAGAAPTLTRCACGRPVLLIRCVSTSST